MLQYTVFNLIYYCNIDLTKAVRYSFFQYIFIFSKKNVNLQNEKEIRLYNFAF